MNWPRKGTYLQGEEDGKYYEREDWNDHPEREPGPTPVALTHRVLLGLDLDLFTIEEVACALRISEQTVRKLIQTGELGGVRLAGGFRISRDSLEELLRTGGRKDRGKGSEPE